MTRGLGAARSGAAPAALPPATPPAPAAPAAPAGWYRCKPAAQAMLRPLVDLLVARRVPADLLTLLAVPVAALGGACLALADDRPTLLLAVPALAAARLVLNLLDGQVARRSGSVHPMGEVANELGDRIADVLFLGGLAFVTGVGALPAAIAIVAALLASLAGIAAKAAGAPRQYGGVMSKPARMVVLAVAAPLAWLVASPAPLLLGAWLIALGSVVTLVQRVRAAGSALDRVWP
ncbi:MAG: CDP-alcohol phosphatidyltransferase family protein [Chloroflexota bacterium]